MFTIIKSVLDQYFCYILTRHSSLKLFIMWNYFSSATFSILLAVIKVTFEIVLFLKIFWGFIICYSDLAEFGDLGLVY